MTKSSLHYRNELTSSNSSRWLPDYQVGNLPVSKVQGTFTRNCIYLVHFQSLLMCLMRDLTEHEFVFSNLYYLFKHVCTIDAVKRFCALFIHL